MKPEDSPPNFMRKSSNGLYTLPTELRKLCIDPRVEKDVITDAARERRYKITSNPCPECGGAVEEWYDPDHVFEPDEPLARCYGQCVDCEVIFDADTGVVFNTSKPWKVEEVLPIIEPKED